MKTLSLIVLLILFSPKTFSTELESIKRVSLMEYAIDLETQYNYNLSWDIKTSYTINFDFFTKAYAYKEGEKCLILGYQSIYTNGMCRLSKAVKAKQHRKSCKKSYYPCNPAVFGQQDGKPFCVSSKLGSELSKYCSYKAITSIKIPNNNLLKNISRTKPQNFKLDNITPLLKDKEFNEKLNKLFPKPLTIQNAKRFTTNLCKNIKESSTSKTQKLDLESCNSQLEILNSTNIAQAKKKIQKKNKNTEVTKPKNIKAHKKAIKTTKNTFKPTRECLEEEHKDKDLGKNIKEIKKITNNLEASLYLKCAKDLYYHKDLPEETRGEYIHKINDQLSFGKQCWNIDKKNVDKNTATFSFVSEEGFQMLSYPLYNYKIKDSFGDEHDTSLPRGVLKFYTNNKTYYISKIDHLGEYFDTFPSNKLEEYTKKKDLIESPAYIERKFLKPYDDFLKRNNKSQITLSSPKDLGFNTDDAKTCIKERLIEYLGIIMNRSHSEMIPHHGQINKDIKNLTSDQLKEKYKKSSLDIKQELKEKILNGSEACIAIMDTHDFDKSFKKGYSQDRIKNYDRYRGYFRD